jgi:hypothetical protein
MAKIDVLESLAPNPSTQTSLFGRGLTTLFAVLGWGTACWLTYVTMPATRRMLEEFGLEVDQLSLFVLRTAWLLTPVAAVVSLGIYWVMPVRWMGRCVLLLPPIAIAIVEGGIYLFYLNVVLQKLG